MLAAAFWESYAEGRDAWSKKKYGWKFRILGHDLTGYHFFLFFVMFPALIFMPLAVTGWDKTLFGVLLSGYGLGLIVEDFFWYIVNPEVKFREWFTDFSDYYPWIKLGDTKIIPVYYVVALTISGLSWYYLWR